MARAQEPEGTLRGCPTCGTRVASASLGMRDFRWVNELLPGKLGGMDIDFTLTQSKTDRALMMELKPKGAAISLGAKLTFTTFVNKGCDVWLVWDEGEGVVAVAKWNGEVGRKRRMSQDRLAQKVLDWWNAGLA